MAKPVYIVCSENGAEDRISGRTSLFNLLEQIQISKLPPDFKGIVFSKVASIWVTAMWMRESEDEGAGEFEFKISLKMPNVAETIEMLGGSFAFEKVFQRIMMRLEGPLPIPGPGIMNVQCMIRRAGTSDWLTQECPIILEEVTPPGIDAAQLPSAAGTQPQMQSSH